MKSQFERPTFDYCTRNLNMLNKLASVSALINFCEHTEHYKCAMYSKISVNGRNTS